VFRGPACKRHLAVRACSLHRVKSRPVNGLLISQSDNEMSTFPVTPSLLH
jgi:hypothetical protein